MGNCWSCIKEPLTGRCSEEETDVVSAAPERPTEPLPVRVVEVDVQTKQNPMESPVASTSMAQTSTTAEAASSESQKPLPTLEEVISSFEGLKTEADNVDELISLIRRVLEKKSKQSKQEDKSNKDKASTSSTLEATSTTLWSEWVKSGARFLEFSSGHVEKMQKESALSRKVVRDILDQVGHLHWAVGGLSVVAYLLENYEKMSANQAKCQQLLERMVDLLTHVKKIYSLVSTEDEKLRKVIVLIIEGSMKCSSQMYSTRLFRFLKSSVDNEVLNDLKEEIDHIYNDLTLTTATTILKNQPVVLSIPKPVFPKNTAGLEERVSQITEMLKLEKLEEGVEVIVIYGFGGIGKTTLANAVVANVELKGFNYTKIEIHEDLQKKMILKVCRSNCSRMSSQNMNKEDK